MTGVCGDRCPIPKIILDIETGNANFCQEGLLVHSDVREATVALMKAIVAKGECNGSPVLSGYSETEDWVRCQNSYVQEIDSLGDALETASAGVVLGARVEEFIEQSKK